MRYEDFDFADLTPEDDISTFDSTDRELNEFLLEESKDYQQELLAMTYLVKHRPSGQVAAYYSLLNDTIRLDETEKRVRNKINRKIPHSKQRNHYPAVKIGRLAVTKEYAGAGLGHFIIESLKVIFTHGNRTGCRFLTVDAVASATGFYERQGFRFFTEQDITDDTRLMYFDLKDFL